MKYQIQEHSLDDLCEISRNEALELSIKRSKVSEVIHREWEKIFTVHPRISFLVGIGMIVFIFIFEFFLAEKVSDNNPENYRFILILAGSLAAAAFSAGFTGSMNIDIKWLQASGALAIFALVYLNSPFSVSSKVEQAPEETLSVNSFLPNIFVSNAYAGSTEQAVPENLADVSIDSEVEARIDNRQVHYIRVYYPVGVSDLKNTAFSIKKNISSLSSNADVYSLGSNISAMLNKMKYDDGRYFVKLRYRPGLEQSKLDSVINSLSSMGVNVQQNDISERYSEADISIYLKML